MDAQEVLKKLEDVFKGITHAQEKASGAEGKADGAMKTITEIKATLDGVDFASMKTAVADATKGLQELQELKQKQAAAEEANKRLEAILARPGNGSGKEGISDSEKKYQNDFIRYMRKNASIDSGALEGTLKEIAHKHFVGLSDDEMAHEVKTLQAGSDPDGGYFIRPTISNTIATRIFETSPIRSLANIETTSSDSHEVLIDDQSGTSGGWVGETQTRSNTNTPQVGKITINIHEQYAMPLATQKMLDDAGFNVEAWLQNKVIDILSRTENTAFVSGTGVGQPKGFLAYSAWAVAGTYERDKLEQINSGSAGNFTGDGIKKLKNSLIESYQGRARFLIRRDAFEDVILLKDGMGRYLVNPDSMRTGDDKILLGKPVVFAQDMQAIASDALAMAYGDFQSGYTIVDRIGIRVLRDPYTSKPYVKFYTTKRVGGAVTNFEAIKIQKLAA